MRAISKIKSKIRPAKIRTKFTESKQSLPVGRKRQSKGTWFSATRHVRMTNPSHGSQSEFPPGPRSFPSKLSLIPRLLLVLSSSFFQSYFSTFFHPPVVLSG